MIVPAAAQAAAPYAETLPPGALRSDSAVLGGRIFAGGEPTTYYVEYGKTTSYGSQIPAAPGDAGSGSATTSALRTHFVSGLEPETTYHYRLVATNASGASEGDDLTFTTPPAPTSGSERAYEQVSAAQKNGWSLYYGHEGQAAVFPGGLSRDGRTAVFTAWGMFAGATGGGLTTYKATRTDTGWVTEPISPPVRDPQGNALDNSFNTLVASTRDFDGQALLTTDAVDPEVDAFDGTMDVYARGLGNPNWTLMSIGNDGERTTDAITSALSPVAIADGGQTVLLQTAVELVPGTGVPGTRQLYLRRRGQTIHIPMPDGNPAPATVSTGVHDPVNERAMLSDDGSRVTFVLSNQIYQWVEGEGTHWVSEPETEITPPQVTLVRPSRDGTRILMRVNRGAGNQLTADGSPDGGFYEYVDHGPGAGDLHYRGGALVHTGTIVFNGQMVASEDLNVVYYQVNLLRDGRGYTELRRLEGSAYETIARAFGTSTSGVILHSVVGREVESTSVTPDGDGLLFYTPNNVVAYPNNGQFMTYYYSEEHGLLCLSCRPDGQPPTRGIPARNGGPYTDSRTSRVSSDGSRVQFAAFAPLVPADINNRSDVYEWHDGRISLLSSGRSTQDSFTVGMSADGRDAVFATSESLVWQDKDGGELDFYNARIGGGFGPEPPGPPAQCSGDICQGASTGGPAGAGKPSSEMFQGSGNVTRASVRVARLRPISGAVATLRVRASGAGRVSVSGRSIRNRRLSVAKSGRTLVRVALTQRVKRTLRKRGKVTVAVRVSFRASDGAVATRRVSVTFKRAKGGRR